MVGLLIYLLAMFIIVDNNVGFAPDVLTSAMLIVAVDIASSIALLMSGRGISKLETEPSGIKATAIVAIIIGVILLFAGALKIGGLVAIIYAIIALVKIGRYEEWFYGEIE